MPGALISRRILISGIPVGSFGLALLAAWQAPPPPCFCSVARVSFACKGSDHRPCLDRVRKLLLCRDVLHPACMYSLVWLMAAITYELYPAEIDPLVWPTVVILLAGTVAFTMGCMLGARPIAKGRPWFTDSRGSFLYRNALLIYCAAMIPFSAIALMKLAGQSGVSPAMFVAARARAVVDAQTDREGRFSTPFCRWRQRSLSQWPFS